MTRTRPPPATAIPFLIVRMPPGAVDGYVATAAQVFADDYRYDPSGSTLTFHKRGNVDAFVGMLRDAMEPDFAEEAEKPSIRHAIQLVIQELARQMVATHGREKAEAKAMSLALSQRTASALELVAAIRAMEPERGENPSRRGTSAGRRFAGHHHPAGVGDWRADEDYERDSLDRDRPPCVACGRHTGSEAWRGDTMREYLCDRCAASTGRRGNPIPEVGSTVRFDPQLMTSPMYEGEEHHQDMILRARRGDEVLLEWPDGTQQWTRNAIVAAGAPAGYHADAYGHWRSDATGNRHFSHFEDEDGNGRRGNPMSGGTCGCDGSSDERLGNPARPPDEAARNMINRLGSVEALRLAEDMRARAATPPASTDIVAWWDEVIPLIRENFGDPRMAGPFEGRRGNPSPPGHHITESRSLDVANTILEQLGGARRLSAMIGAKNFMGEGARPGLHEGDLQFQFSAKAKNRANAVRVELKGDRSPCGWRDDTYTVTFYRTATPLQTFDGIYADGLTRLFELQTGLALRL